MKYVKTYEGVVTGSLGGREDVYPETKYVHYNSIESLAKDFGTKRGERYYKVEELNYREVEKQAKETLKALEEKDKQKQKEELLKEKKRIEEQLKRYE